MTAPGAPAGNDRTTLFGVLGIVLGLLCCGPAGLVLGYLSLNQSKQHGSSSGLAWAAIIVGILGTIWQVYWTLVNVL